MNLFEYQLPKPNSELFSTLLKHKNIEIKQIVSNSLAKSQRFVGEFDEWFVLLEGEALFEVNGKKEWLKCGDIRFIEAKKEHFVHKTKGVALWLAIYIQ